MSVPLFHIARTVKKLPYIPSLDIQSCNLNAKEEGALIAVGLDDFLLRDEWSSLRVVSERKLEPYLDLRVLDLVEQYGLRTTVFLSGSTVRRFPTLAKEILGRGHEVAGHGMMHEDLRLVGSSQRVRDTIKQSLSILAESARQRVEGWKNPGFFQDKLVRKGLGQSEVNWCTGTIIPLVLAKFGCCLLPFKDHDSKVELPTAPELIDYYLYVERRTSPRSFERTWTRLTTRFGSSVLIFTIHPWLHLLEEDRFKALGRVFECFAASATCLLQGQIYQMFGSGQISVSRTHQFALRLASRISENARNLVTSRPAERFDSISGPPGDRDIY